LWWESPSRKAGRELVSRSPFAPTTRFVANAILESLHVDEGELLEQTILRASRETDILNYEIVLPVSEIQSTNVFDLEIYERFFAPKAHARKTMRRK
jgi:hypothetical protein